MLMTLVQMVLPALVVFVTLFGLLARGNPKPGGVALFLRVGIAGLVLGGALYFLMEKTAALVGQPTALVVNVYRGLLGGGLLLVAFAAFGSVLKRQR